MRQDTKIVFIHKGYNWYLPYVLYQAKYASPNSDIVLIGDILRFKGIQVEFLDNLQGNDIYQFKRDYSHMSTLSEQSELFCWSRWFYLLNYMRKYKVRSVLYLDSDVLLYSSIEEIKSAYSDLTWECGLSIPREDSSSMWWWSVSGHISYWTIDCLEDFCRIIINSFHNQEYLKQYRRKWDWHLSKQMPGGICDMTALYLFWKDNKNRIINLAKSHKSNVFDHSINLASNSATDRYVAESGIKKVKFVNRRPFFFRADEAGKLDRVHALHLQGDAKRFIRRFYTGKLFRGKTYGEGIFLLKSIKNKIRKLFNSR